MPVKAGVRNYEKSLDRIHRKVARDILEETVKKPVRITEKRNDQIPGQADLP